jgi:glycosyltransferase involved in cell wall biosynthesis
VSDVDSGPLVSIIIIAYNDRAYVAEAVDSALGQTYGNREVIVIDDGSTDGTGELIAKRYGSRVNYGWKHNGGQGSARSLGLEIASGTYIQHLDSDDILMPRKLEMQAGFLDAHPECAFV